MTNNEALLAQLRELLAEGYTGQIVLHCSQGNVSYFDINRRLRVDAEQALLIESKERPTATRGSRGT